MGISQSSQSHTAGPSLGHHGPHLSHRRGRQLNWWEVMKLGAVTVTVGALQWFKMYLVMLEDRNTNEQRRQQLGPHHNGEAQPAGKNFASGMSLESRQAVIQMIDHIVTPMLVDQWRLGLVKVLLDPEEGPILPDEDPDMRKGLLASIQSYQAERDSRPTFRAGHVPSRYDAARPQIPSRPSQARAAQAEHASSLQQAQAASTSRSGKVQAAGSTTQRPISSAVLSEHQPSSSRAMPSAPPLYPEVQHPSAPPMTEDWQCVEEPQREQESAECGVCLDADVEIEIDNCHHKLCCECAKAICCLEGRAPQCPFCRGAMTGVTSLSA